MHLVGNARLHCCNLGHRLQDIITTVRAVISRRASLQHRVFNMGGPERLSRLDMARKVRLTPTKACRPSICEEWKFHQVPPRTQHFHSNTSCRYTVISPYARALIVGDGMVLRCRLLKRMATASRQLWQCPVLRLIVVSHRLLTSRW